MNQKVRVIENAVLSAALMISVLPINIYANEDNNTIEKEETVYTVLNNDGTVNNTIVSSWLHDEGGIRNISEKLDQYNVENVKNDENPIMKNNIYTWNSKYNDVYYQGNTNKQLPISIKISYQLDGKELSYKQVQGKNGHLKMNIHVTNGVSKNVNINGKNVTIHPSYLGLGMLMLDTEHYTNVKCQMGEIINDGTNEILAFTVIPGFNETLKQMGLEKINNKFNISDDVIIEADVKDFDTASLMMGFTNEIDFGNDLSELSVDSITGGMSELMSASNQLLNGSDTLYQGVIELNDSAKPLTSAYPQINELANSTTILHDGTSSLLSGINVYTNGVSELNQGNKQLYQISQGTAQIHGGSKTLEEGATSIQKGVEQIKTQIDNLDENTMSQLSMMLEASKQRLVQMSSLIETDSKTLSSMENVLNDLKSSMKQLDAAKTMIEEEVNEYNEVIKSNNKIIQNNNQLIGSFKNEIDSVNNRIQQATNDTNSKIDETIISLNNVLSNTTDENTIALINQQIQQLENSKISIDQIITSSDGLVTLDEIDSTKILSILNEIQSKFSGMSSILGQSEQALSDLSKDVETAKVQLDDMQKMLSKADSSLPKGIDQTILSLKKAMEQLYVGSQRLVTGSTALEQGLSELNKKSKEGIDKVNAASEILVENNDTLVQGAYLLNEGADKLEKQKGSFTDMSKGLKQLQVAFDELQNGAKQLYEGQSQFNEQGLSKLKDVMDLTVSEVGALDTMLKEIDTLNKENRNFSGSPENADCEVRFVFKTNN